MAKPTQSGTAVASAARARRDAERYLMNTYKRPSLVFVRGKGCRLYDEKGKEYLDFLGGIAVNALGHAHPRLVRTLRREAGRATHLSNLFHNEFQGPLARKLARWSGMDRAFFTNSGTEAIEGALKLARIWAKQSAEGKTRILALENSFHGRTFGALSITSTEKYRAPFTPLVPGVEFVRFNDVGDLESKCDSRVCAIVIEPIQGEGGIRAVSEAFWNRARQLATRHKAALIADEIQCGLGRTGCFFAYQKFGLKPDVVLVAKPLAAGLPLAAILAREKVAQAFSPGMHGTTFGGGPLQCRLALKVLEILERPGFLDHVRQMGVYLRAHLETLRKELPVISELRGEGLIQAAQLTVPCKSVVRQALEAGVLMNCTQEKVLRFLPPLIIEREHVDALVETLRPILAALSPVAAARG